MTNHFPVALKSSVRLLFLLPIVLPLTTQARADVVFSDFGSGNSYAPDIGWGPLGANLIWFGPGNNPINGPRDTAASFTASSDTTLTQIDVALTTPSADDTQAISIDLESDNGGSPGTVIESWDLNGPFPIFGSTSNTVQTLLSNGTVSLSAGTEYWLVIAPQSDNTLVVWDLSSNESAPGTGTELSSAGVWSSAPGTVAFDVQGSQSPVPEPSTWPLLGGAAIALAIAVRRRPMRRPAREIGNRG
jgi:hypothetical protein